MDFRRDSKDDLLQTDEELDRTLKNFRLSVHAWSEAVYGQPHKPVRISTRSWQVVAGWALGCALAVGSLAGGIYDHHLKEHAKVAAAAEAARQQRLEVEQHNESEDLLATVDIAISREVPSAMEPLAQLMAEDSEQ
jgi:hypothetical protein